MSKEITKIECSVCESHYKLVYDPNNTSGYPKFCSFCGSECFDDDDEFLNNDEED